MYKTILVPVDGSPFSEQALEEALRLARSSGGRIELVSVLLEYGGYGPHVSKLDDAMTGAVDQYVMQLEQQVRKAGVEAGRRVLRGMPAPVIVDTAREVRADLIVMASHGTGAVGPRVPSYGLGGVTFKVIHDAPCPVLVLPIRPNT